ncbi:MULTISPECIES: ATP-binding protein [Cobetia]|uniref:histidine kinase n=1 Tax=Cobetia crustatorum TaxID=553385 RepID=A0A558HEK4_9GAMM|nr:MULTISPECIES: ATP-binding protein [Cobetia]TVU67507.1 ATP-binding protein [Cobetia crustatorum]
MLHIDRRSLRFRLLTRLGGVALAVVLLAWYLHGFFLHQLAQDFLGERLKDEATHVVTLLKQGDRPAVELLTAAREEYQVFHHFYVLRIAGQTSTSHPAMLTTLMPLLAGSDALFTLQDQQHPLLVYRHTFQVQGQSAQLLIAENFSPVQQGLDRVHWWIGGTAILLWGVLVSLNLLAVRRGLRPLMTLGHQLKELQAGRRKRIALEAPSELDSLVTQLNHLLDEFDRRLTRSRESVANLSHALKTPLAALAQVLRGRRPIDDVRRTKMLARVESLHAQLAAELQRARIAGPRAGQATRPVEEAERLIEMFCGLYPERRFSLEVASSEVGQSSSGASSWVSIETQDFTEMLGIVLDNAGKWSRQQVRCRLAINATTLKLTVDDDGPGVPHEEHDRLGERGRRLDERYPGYGLGLSILAQLVTHYAGQLYYSSAPEGGLRVEMTLPVNQPTPIQA